MIRGVLRKVFTSSAFYIAFSLLVSIALWMFIEINENQIITHPVRDVPVVRINERIVSDRSFLITSMSPETVTLTFQCPRSVAQKLTKDTLSVVIDLATINQRGPTTLRYEIVYPQGVGIEEANLTSSSVNLISLIVDRISSNPVRVSVPYTGGAAEGFMLEPVQYNPQQITVHGPAEVVSKVSSARVNILRKT